MYYDSCSVAMYLAATKFNDFLANLLTLPNFNTSGKNTCRVVCIN